MSRITRPELAKDTFKEFIQQILGVEYWRTKLRDHTFLRKIKWSSVFKFSEKHSANVVRRGRFTKTRKRMASTG
mgnify:CR=1 FL=1